jgi:hypothetical protein
MRNKRLGFGLFMLLAIGLGIVACEEQDVDKTFDGPYFVRFTDSTLTYKESYNQPISIKVHNVGPLLNEAITVNYTIAGSAREGRDYTIEGTKGTVVIPAQQSFGEIKLRLINNANNILESQTLEFTLTSVQPSSLQIGLGPSGTLGKKLTFTLQDDCLFSGTYTGVLRLGAQSATRQGIAITSTGTNCQNYTVANWNIGLGNLFGFNAVRAPLTFIDNGDNSLTIPPQVSSYLETPYDTIRGTGSWNPQNRQITLNVRLKVPREGRSDTTLTLPYTYTPQ